ncbi:MAG: 4'-phosphopantetheinyl transferase [Alphaproteobacteria bacterium]
MSLSDVFDKDLFETFFSRIDSVEGNVFSEEETLVAKAVDSRKKEFRSGRIASRKTLERWGYGDSKILAVNRMPVFPLGTVGSISHTKEYVIAVSALRENCQSIGIDLEEISRVSQDLWHLIFTIKETEIIKKAEEESLAALFFSAKESFFKMQYPITQKMLDFKEVEISFGKDNSWQVRCENSEMAKALGKYAVEDDIVCTLCYLL